MSSDHGPDASDQEPDITELLGGLASSRTTAGPDVFAPFLTHVHALEPAPASRANLPSLVRVSLQLDSHEVTDVAAALGEVTAAITGAAVAVLSWADRRGEVDLTLVEQAHDVTLLAAANDPLELTIEVGGVFAGLATIDAVQVALALHWFLDRGRAGDRPPRPGLVVRDEYATFATGLTRVVGHAGVARQELVLDVQFRADGRRLVGLRTAYAEPAGKKRRARRR